MVALLVQVTGYWMLQFFFYKMIRDNVDDYHQSAIDTGHSFAFNNSGISTKLTDDQREDYKDWLKANVRDIPNASILTYSWLDGQGRSHDVANQVIIDPVEDYNLTHTMFLFPLEIATLTTALTLGGKALADLLSSEYMGCEYPCTAGTFADLAIPFEGWGLAVSAVAHFGIEDNGTFGSSSGNDAWPYIITWIDSVPHNRLVDVYQTQRHQGADLGAWSTEYPLTTSSARASFAGTGAIYSPDPHHDATMILTDFLTSHLLGNLAEPIKDVEGEIQAGLIGNEEEEEEEDED